MQLTRFVRALALLLALGGCSTSTNLLRETFTGSSAASANSLDATPVLRGHPQPAAQGSPGLRVHLVRLTDDRKLGGTQAHHLGKIGSTVMDMHTSTLQLSAPAADVLTRILKDQFQLDGLTVQDHAEGADFEVRGSISRMRLDIAGSDEFDLAVHLSVHQISAGKVTWTGTIDESSERFAGISGNSRASIVRLLNQNLERWSDKVGSTLLEKNAWRKTAPALPAAVQPVAPAPVPTPAVVTAMPRPPELANTQPLAPVKAPDASVTQGPPKGYGYFSAISIPTRVKVYSDDIYYGLTPLRVMVPTGVVTFEFRFDGYKTVVQKVMIRKDETTELQFQLQKR